MAIITRYVNTASSGGDGTTNAISGVNAAYASLNAWEAAEQTDLVLAGNSHVVICEGTAADTTAVIVDGWTTNATFYITIRTDTAGRHTGIWSTSKYRLSINGATVLTVNEDYTRCYGIQVEDVGSAAHHNLIIFSLGNYFRFGYGIVRKAVLDITVHTGFFSNTNGNTAYIYNTIIYDIGNAGYDDSGAGVFIYWYNCTAQNCAIRGFHSWGNRGVAKNCIAQDCLDGYVGNWNTTDSRNNNSDIVGDAPGSSPSTGVVTFTNKAGDDFSLAASDAYAKDLGTSLASDSVFPFSDDIISVIRSDTWDIGAFAYITTGGITIPILLHNIMGGFNEIKKNGGFING